MNQNNICKFTKHFEEPSEKYVCFSAVLFYKEKYIKTTRNLKVTNVSKNKIKSFIMNLTDTIKKFINGTYPNNYYLRLYYDKSLFKLKVYKDLFKTLHNQKNNKIQLVEYECESFKNNKNNHMDLFGTLIRFYSIFDTQSVNMDYCVLIDADATYEHHFLQILDEFIKSNNLIYAISKLTQVPFYSNDCMTNNNEFLNYVHFIASSVIIKRDPIFNIKYWDTYFNRMFEQNDLMYVYNYLDFKRFFMGGKIEFENKPQSYSSFFYGTDEIWLNYVLKKILIDNNSADKLKCYFTKDYDLYFVLNKLKDFLNHANERNFAEFNFFLKNCVFLGELKERTFHNFSTFIDHLLKNKNKKNNIEKIIQFFKDIRKNRYFNRFYIQSNIRYIINHIEELIKMTKNLKYNQILHTKI